MKKLFWFVCLLLPNFLWSQREMRARVFYPQALQLEEIFNDFITEERNNPYYSDNLTYQLTITIYDSTYLCELRAGISHFSSDSIFIDEEYMDVTPQQYIVLINRPVQVYVFNEGNLPPYIPFIRRSDDLCTVIGVVNNQNIEILDDSIIPAVWQFSYKNGNFRVTRKYDATY